MWWEKNNQGTGFVEMRLNPAEKILIAGRAIWFYLRKLFVPVNLMFSYPRWDIEPGDIWQYAWPVASVVMIVIAWFLRNRIGRGLLTAILFFVTVLFPMLGFFHLYTFVYTYVADHYQYAACIGPIALVAAAGAIVYGRAGKNTRFIIMSAAGVLLLTLGVLTYRQCRIYKNPETLWQDTLKENPDSWLAHSQTAGILFRQGKINEAKSHLERTIELAGYLKEIHPRAYADFYCNLSLIAQAQGKLGEAADDYKRSLEIFENSALVHYRLAEILVKEGKKEVALTHYRRALEIAQAKGADNLADEIRGRIAAIEGQK
jgi:tetratricopeptide (TPR) repeat protein